MVMSFFQLCHAFQITKTYLSFFNDLKMRCKNAISFLTLVLLTVSTSHVASQRGKKVLTFCFFTCPSYQLINPNIIYVEIV